MADRWMERKFAELDTAPLFDPPASQGSTQEKPRRRPPRNVGRAECPTCGKEVGLYVASTRGHQRVLAYRKHWRRRYSGEAFTCPRSNTETSE